MIYFDIAPAYGVMSGIVQVELGARILIPHQDDTVDVKFISCGRLRCSATAALHLRNAIDASLKMLEQPQPNPVGALGEPRNRIDVTVVDHRSLVPKPTM